MTAVFRIAAAVVSPLIALGACATPGGVFGERITNVEILPPYSRNGVAAMTAGGAPVEVRGSPPGGADAEAVVAAMRLPAGLPQGPLRAIEPGSAPASQRLLIIFGLRNAANALTVCGETPNGGAAPTLSAFVAVCVGGRTASSAFVVHNEALGPGDPSFTEALQRAIALITPRRNPMMEADRCKRPPCL